MLDLRSFTNRQKLQAIRREIKVRKWLYPRWIAQGKMREGHAEYELAIMYEIANDYGRLVEKEQSFEPAGK